MITQIREFVSGQTQDLVEQVQKFREDPVESARKIAVSSAESLKSLKQPVRAFAHSSMRLATVSQNAVQGLIELQSEVITSALTAAATRLERAARAGNVIDLVRDQAEMLPATRERIVNEATRAVEILRDAGRDVRKVGTQLYGKVLETAEDEHPRAKSPRARKAKRAVRKSAGRSRKAAA
jgi:phasin family protein